MLAGQWLGRYQGTNNGICIVDFDNFEDHFEGHAYVFDDAGMPGSLLFLRTPDRSPKQSLEVTLAPTHPKTGEILPREQLTAIAPGIVYPEKATINFELKDDTLSVAWTTSIGSNGIAALPRCRSAEPSDILPEAGVDTWDQFKARVAALEPYRDIFRGQPTAQRLRTAFHRTSRKDLIRFMRSDIPTLHQTLTSRTRHLFNLSDPLQNAAFWNLIQHHGYPTPLLDWSYSPFVAAFFSFRNPQRLVEDPERVRVFMFDATEWAVDFKQLQKAAFAQPHFSLLAALAIENLRAIPQQSLSSVTNVDDIESYIRSREAERNKRYLRVFELPYSEREKVLKELAMMGIAAGSLFPGLDGACEELKARFFGY